MSCVLQWNKVRQRAIQWLGQGWTVLGRAVFLQCLYYYIAYFQPHTFLVSLTQLVGDENEPRVAVGKETLLRLRRLLGPTDQMQRTGQLYASSSLRFSIGTLRPFTFHWWREVYYFLSGPNGPEKLTSVVCVVTVVHQASIYLMLFLC